LAKAHLLRFFHRTNLCLCGIFAPLCGIFTHRLRMIFSVKEGGEMKFSGQGKEELLELKQLLKEYRVLRTEQLYR
jgi:hypothetical protein